MFRIFNKPRHKPADQKPNTPGDEQKNSPINIDKPELTAYQLYWEEKMLISIQERSSKQLPKATPHSVTQHPHILEHGSAYTQNPLHNNPIISHTTMQQPGTSHTQQELFNHHTSRRSLASLSQRVSNFFSWRWPQRYRQYPATDNDITVPLLSNNNSQGQPPQVPWKIQ